VVPNRQRSRDDVVPTGLHVLGTAEAAPRSLLGQISGFGLISALGLTLDCGLFAVLVHGLGGAPGWSNAISAGCAVTFVFICSIRRVFADQGGRLLPRYLLYGACQIVLVAAASAAVGWLDAKGWWPMVAKVSILPVTFGCNFLIMKLLVALARSRTCAALPS